MKAITLFFSLVLMSCVTAANAESTFAGAWQAAKAAQQAAVAWQKAERFALHTAHETAAAEAAAWEAAEAAERELADEAKAARAAVAEVAVWRITVGFWKAIEADALRAAADALAEAEAAEAAEAE